MVLVALMIKSKLLTCKNHVVKTVTRPSQSAAPECIRDDNCFFYRVFLLQKGANILLSLDILFILNLFMLSLIGFNEMA